MSFMADRKERLASLAGVGLLHLMLGWALLLSLAPALVESVSEPLGVFNVREVPPPPPEPRPEPEIRRVAERAPAPAEPSGLSAPPAPRRQAPPVVAPKRIVERGVPPPVAAGLVPASGSSGPFSSARNGNGTGSGGTGSGTGSGGAGSGSGGGGSGGTGVAVVRPRLRSGTITRRDYPKAANGDQGTVEARLSVSATGAVTSCTVTRSSGNAVLDATTCRLIRERFRFTPARDAQGNAVPSVQGWQQKWWRD